MKARNESAYKLFIAAIINFLIAAVYLYVLNTYYASNDDFIFAEYIADGYYNIKMSNYFLFSFIGFFQRIIYPINAYTLFNIVLSYISFTSITRVLLDRFTASQATLLTLFINAGFAVNQYIVDCFTYMPAIMCTAGFLCIIHYSKREHWIFGTLFGTFWVIFGSLYRFKIFEVCVLFTAAFILLYTVVLNIEQSKKEKFVEFIKRLFEAKRLTACILAVALAFGLNLASTKINTSTPELAYYSDYTAARSKVWDYRIPDYDECSAEYDAIGIDENDIIMLRSGFMDDGGAFTLEKLNQINAIKESYYKDKSAGKLLKEMLKGEAKCFTDINNKGAIHIFFAVLLIAFIVVSKKKRYLIPTGFIIITAALYAYLWYIERPPFRAVYPIWFSSVVLLIYSVDKSSIREKTKQVYKTLPKLFAVATIILSVSFAYLTFSHTEIFACKFIRDNATPVAEYFHEHPKDRFEIALSADIYDENFKYDNSYHIKRIEADQNYKIFNCTYYKLPYDTQCCINIFGTENMYENLLNDGVYFVYRYNNEVKRETHTYMKNYLEKYYTDGQTVSCELIEQFGDYKIYNYSLE